jgi:hypothetical protein
MGGNPLSGIKVPDPSVQRSPGHAEVMGGMGCGLALFDESAGISDLAVTEDRSPSAEVHAGIVAFGAGVIDAFSFNLELHLRQRCHDGEDHGPHRGAGIDIPATEF